MSVNPNLGSAFCAHDNMPAHQVTITKGFWIGQTEVTQQAWLIVKHKNPSVLQKGPTLPVNNVNWNDAVNYCGATGMRLPTEAEWEYAARAGRAADDYDGVEAWADKKPTLHPVGLKPPNNWGLYDMLGNVWEWVADLYADGYTAASETDPHGPSTGKDRILRGASWTSRFKYGAGGSGLISGVRCAGN